ncbi:esterase-like activity of phytase family protein [Xanthobacteraceae bacterium A53D]
MRLFSRRNVLLGLAAGAGGVALAHSALSRTRELPLKPLPITVDATPIDRFRFGATETRFGTLEFCGGLVLTSPFSGFGGLSAFTLDAKGERFLSVTDRGLFISGRLVTEGDRPIGLADVRAAALMDGEGVPLARQARGDSESIAIAPDAVYVGLETINEVWRFPGPDPLGTRGRKVPVPPAVGELRHNTGLESLVYVPDGPLKGALLGIGELGQKNDDDLPGFIIGGPTPGLFTVAKSYWYSATDAAIGPDGMLYLLERHFSFTAGVSMQIRRFRLADVKPGARLQGETLIEADMAYEIDNMEGLAVTRNAAGQTLLTLVSDDNFNPLQRNILLRFAIRD